MKSVTASRWRSAQSVFVWRLPIFFRACSRRESERKSTRHLCTASRLLAIPLHNNFFRLAEVQGRMQSIIYVGHAERPTKAKRSRHAFQSSKLEVRETNTKQKKKCQLHNRHPTITIRNVIHKFIFSRIQFIGSGRFGAPCDPKKVGHFFTYFIFRGIEFLR